MSSSCSLYADDCVLNTPRPAFCIGKVTKFESARHLQSQWLFLGMLLTVDGEPVRLLHWILPILYWKHGATYRKRYLVENCHFIGNS